MAASEQECEELAEKLAAAFPRLTVRFEALPFDGNFIVWITSQESSGAFNENHLRPFLPSGDWQIVTHDSEGARGINFALLKQN